MPFKSHLPIISSMIYIIVLLLVKTNIRSLTPYLNISREKNENKKQIYTCLFRTFTTCM